MRTKFAAILIATSCVGCVTEEGDKGAVNPSDIAYAGTGLAVVSSAGIDDDSFSNSFNNSNPNSNPNSTPNNSNPNSNFNSSFNSGTGTPPWELDCEATLRVSGAVDDTFSETSGCSGGSGSGDTQALSWVWGLQDQYQLMLEDAPIRSASDTSSFETSVLFRPFDLGASGPESAWRTTCTVNIDSSSPYDGSRGDPSAVWIGSADCPDPATPVERAEITSDWTEVDGDPVVIESFTFETPYPKAN